MDPASCAFGIPDLQCLVWAGNGLQYCLRGINCNVSFLFAIGGWNEIGRE